jgi:hypothetical protein
VDLGLAVGVPLREGVLDILGMLGLPEDVPGLDPASTLILPIDIFLRKPQRFPFSFPSDFLGCNSMGFRSSTMDRTLVARSSLEVVGFGRMRESGSEYKEGVSGGLAPGGRLLRPVVGPKLAKRLTSGRSAETVSSKFELDMDVTYCVSAG